MNYSMNNRDLYESKEVLEKYSGYSTRTRSLNNAERDLIDRFDFKNKNILVVGCGAGRVAANLLLYGNNVTGVDRSRGMVQNAKKNFPSSRFSALSFLHGDATDLSFLMDNSFDVVFFPQNGIDYIETVLDREKALVEMSKKVRGGGIVSFSSHNKLAYVFSPKVPFFRHSFSGILSSYVYKREHVIGGGVIFKGSPRYVIEQTTKLTRMKFFGYTYDTRNRVERFLAKSIFLSRWYFPYINYVFKKL